MSDNDSQSEYIQTFSVGYYRGLWVLVPMFFVPKDAYDPATGMLRHYGVKILEGGPVPELEKRDSSAAWEKKFEQAEACLIPWIMKDEELEELKALCRRFDIPFSWVIKPVKIKTNPEKRNKLTRRFEKGLRKNKPLSDEEFSVFRKELKKLSPKAALICDILREVNGIFNEGGGYVSLEEIVRLQVPDVAPMSDDVPNWVRFSRTIPSGMHMICTCLSTRLWKSLCRQVNEDSIFVFSNIRGAPLSPVHVNELIRAAAKNAGIVRAVSSLSFRPPISIESVRKSLIMPHLQPVMEKEWEQMCQEIPLLKRCRGRPSVHDQLSILNTILKKMRGKGYYADPPLHQPPREVIKSQRRRWEKNGVLEAIIAFRKSKITS